MRSAGMVCRTGAVAVAAAAVATVAVGTAQAESAVPRCTDTQQVDSTLSYGGAAAGTRGGYLQFTAKPGAACVIPGVVPVGLVGAHDVLVANDAPADSPAVYLRDGASAYVQLTWTVVSPERQQTPLAVTVEPEHPEDRGITVTWTLGPVDATPESHSIHVGPATPGAAPAGPAA
ncbi:DUF4232 domain-containing protein [Amycolatopsis viridis]|uniref:DUF4232 domain-containing protein n=1 Tax=Amycolatopsis viridis TaxID=185678 RepID=A0ABX0SWN9_9PSEU|nr:DUF4232 domain-containing protein [Amycolatopsis viridis]NIH81353.1 hypothetical protein [Amycolatopsis viridis]